MATSGVDVAGRPIWHIDLPRRKLGNVHSDLEGLRVAESPEGLLSYHPVVIGDVVVVNMGTGDEDFEAIRLHTGETVFARGPPHSEEGRGPAALELASGVPRFTMSAYGDRLYARVGSPVTGTNAERGLRRETAGRLVGLNLRAQRKRVLDIRLSDSDFDDHWAFDGSPVTDGAFLYVALRRRDSVRAEAHVACFDSNQGRLQWCRFLCAAEATSKPRPLDVTHSLLTLDQGTLYFNTNMGVVAALRARDGDCRWLTTYPRVPLRRDDPDRNELHRFRDLNPCVIKGDMVYVAPRDSDRIFALDATTGHPLWMTERAVDAIHLLGVAAERLLVSGDVLYWLDRYTGRLRGQFPGVTKAVPGHARPSPRGWGRGVLAGSHVYWPTRNTIYVFDQQTVYRHQRWQPVLVREIPLGPRGASGGNLVIAQDVLLVATADRLIAFNQTGKPDYDRGQRSSSR